ncbi:MAG: hypothetical protein PUE84_03715 [Firmicutes bacterium]|nr:hypothetical protein [Bacillota bacterium]
MKPRFLFSYYEKVFLLLIALLEIFMMIYGLLRFEFQNLRQCMLNLKLEAWADIDSLPQISNRRSLNTYIDELAQK